VTKALVIGAGIAGLTAARALCRDAGFRVLVVEKESRPGGLAITLERAGCRVDLGPHRIHTELPEAQAVFDEAPPDHRTVAPRRSQMLVRGHLFDYPPSPREFALRMPLRSIGFGLSLLAARMGGGAGRDEPESFASVARAMYGRRLSRFFFEPFARKVWKTDSDRLSTDLVRLRIASGNGGLANVLRPQTLDQVRYLRGGIEALPLRLAGDVEREGGEILLDAEVVALEGEENRVGAVVCKTKDGPQRFEPDVVLSTAPLPQLAGWLQPLRADGAAAKSAQGLEFIKMVFVNLIVDKPRVSDNTWIYFPESHVLINRAHEPKNFDPGMAPKLRSLLCGEVTCRGDDDNWRANDSQLVETLRMELHHFKVLHRRDIVQSFVHRIEYGYPLYTLDYRKRLDPILRYVGGFQNVVTFGRQGLFAHNNMDHSIVMGLRAAEAVQHSNPAGAMRANMEEFRRFRIVD